MIITLVNLSTDINEYLNGSSTIIDDNNVPKDMELPNDLKEKMLSIYITELNVLKRDLLIY